MKRIVLMYHDVYRQTDTASGFNTPSASFYKVSAEKFEEQVRFIHHYCQQNNLPLNHIEFTFDDGGESFYSIIAPILEKYGYKGVFFVSTKYIDSPCFLTKAQINELCLRGHVIASHSHSHPKNMSKLSMDELMDEWGKSIQTLENITQVRIEVASIPSGFSSRNVFKSASQSDIKVLYTSVPTTKSIYRCNITTIGRYAVHSDTTLNDISRLISNSSYRNLILIKYRLLWIVKKCLGGNYDRIKNLVISIRRTLS